MSQPPTLIPGPTRVPLSFGLFSAVPPRNDPADMNRWVLGGLQFESPWMPYSDPDSGETSIRVKIVDCESAEGPLPPVDAGLTTFETSLVFVVEAGFSCTPVGVTLEQAQDIASQRLLEREEAAVERAIRQGATDPSLVGPEVQEFSTSNRLRAFSWLDQNMAQDYGVQGTVLTSRAGALAGIKESLVSSRGGRLSTELGIPLAAASGLTPWTQIDSDEMILEYFGLPPMVIYRSGIFTFPSEEIFDRGENNAQVVAQRYYAVGFDGGGIYKATVTS